MAVRFLFYFITSWRGSCESRQTRFSINYFSSSSRCCLFLCRSASCPVICAALRYRWIISTSLAFQQGQQVGHERPIKISMETNTKSSEKENKSELSLASIVIIHVEFNNHVCFHSACCERVTCDDDDHHHRFSTKREHWTRSDISLNARNSTHMFEAKATTSLRLLCKRLNWLSCTSQPTFYSTKRSSNHFSSVAIHCSTSRLHVDTNNRLTLLCSMPCVFSCSSQVTVDARCCNSPDCKRT
jgi:hypothetical protein